MKRITIIELLDKYVKWKLAYNAANEIIESRKGNLPTNTELFQMAADMLEEDERKIKSLEKRLAKAKLKKEVKVVLIQGKKS